MAGVAQALDSKSNLRNRGNIKYFSFHFISLVGLF